MGEISRLGIAPIFACAYAPRFQSIEEVFGRLKLMYKQKRAEEIHLKMLVPKEWTIESVIHKLDNSIIERICTQTF